MVVQIKGHQITRQKQRRLSRPARAPKAHKLTKRRPAKPKAGAPELPGDESEPTPEVLLKEEASKPEQAEETTAVAHPES